MRWQRNGKQRNSISRSSSFPCHLFLCPSASLVAMISDNASRAIRPKTGCPRRNARFISRTAPGTRAAPRDLAPSQAWDESRVTARPRSARKGFREENS